MATEFENARRREALKLDLRQSPWYKASITASVPVFVGFAFSPWRFYTAVLVLSVGLLVLFYEYPDSTSGWRPRLLLWRLSVYGSLPLAILDGYSVSSWDNRPLAVHIGEKILYAGLFLSIALRILHRLQKRHGSAGGRGGALDWLEPHRASGRRGAPDWLEPHRAKLRRRKLFWKRWGPKLNSAGTVLVVLLLLKYVIVVHLAVASLPSVVTTVIGAEAYLQLVLAKELAQAGLMMILILLISYLTRHGALVPWAAAVVVDFSYFQLFGAATPAYLAERRRIETLTRRWWGPILRRLHFSCVVGFGLLAVILIPWHGSLEQCLRVLEILFIAFVAILPFMVFGLPLRLVLRARRRHGGRLGWARFESFALSRDSLKHSLKSVLFVTVLIGMIGRVFLPGFLSIIEDVQFRIDRSVSAAMRYRSRYDSLVHEGFTESAVLHHWAKVPDPDSAISGLELKDAGEYVRDPANRKSFMNWLFLAATMTMLVTVVLPAVLSALRDSRAKEVVKRVAKSTLFAVVFVAVMQIVVDALFLVESSRLLTIGFLFTVVLSFHLDLGASSYDDTKALVGGATMRPRTSIGAESDSQDAGPANDRGAGSGGGKLDI